MCQENVLRQRRRQPVWSRILKEGGGKSNTSIPRGIRAGGIQRYGTEKKKENLADGQQSLAQQQEGEKKYGEESNLFS